MPGQKGRGQPVVTVRGAVLRAQAVLAPWLHTWHRMPAWFYSWTGERRCSRWKVGFFSLDSSYSWNSQKEEAHGEAGARAVGEEQGREGRLQLN